MDAERVTIERLVAGGDGLGRMADGRVVFIAGGLPGEVVGAEIVESRSDFARGRIATLETPSADRVEPPCRHVGRGCGGCGWQHMSVAAQLVAKVEIVREALRRTGRIEDATVEAHGAVPAVGSRTNLRLAVADDGSLGFRRAASRDVVTTQGCLVAHPLALEVIDAARVTGAAEVSLRVSPSTGERAVWLHDERGRDARGATIEGLPADVRVGRRERVHDVVHGVRLRASMAAFFQASAVAAELLVEAVNDAAGDDALSGTDGPVVDAYGGVGLFAATLLDLDVPVTLLESSAASCADARGNLRDHDVTIVQGEVERWAAHPAGLVIADPARSGLGRRGVEALVATGAPRFVLVSCDPVAGARDLGLLIESGYTLERVRVLDLFPHTPHVECVSVLTRTT